MKSVFLGVLVGVLGSLVGYADEPKIRPIPLNEPLPTVEEGPQTAVPPVPGAVIGDIERVPEVRMDIAASEITMEDHRGFGQWVVCRFVARAVDRDGFESTGFYESNGYGSLDHKLNSACSICKERNRRCEFAGCTVRPYEVLGNAERVFSKGSVEADLILDDSIDVSCNDRHPILRTARESKVGILEREERRGHSSTKERESSPQERRLGPSERDGSRGGNVPFHSSRSYSFSRSFERDSSGYMHQQTEIEDSRYPFRYREEVFRPPFSRRQSQAHPMREQDPEPRGSAPKEPAIQSEKEPAPKPIKKQGSI